MKREPVQETAHAKLSASGAHRWAYCAGSVEAEAGFSDEQSPFAAEGTAAHELAEHCLKTGCMASDCLGETFNDHEVTEEMADYTQVYIDTCRELMSSKSVDLIEERVEFTRWVEEGFGTADFISFDPRINKVTMVDLKYGKGVQVEAINNLQLALYGLGTLQELEFIGVEDFVNLSFDLIVSQPRRDHHDVWTIDLKELLGVGEWLKERAAEAMKPNAPRTPSEKACTFCRARFTCRTKAEHDLDMVTDDYSDDFKEVKLKPAEDLTDAELANLYPHLASIEKWAKSLKEYCLAQAIAGKKLDNLKLVKGRTTRSWADEDEAAIALLGLKLDDEQIYETKILSVAKIEKLLGKKNVVTTDETLVAKTEGKPALVVATDKRAVWVPHDEKQVREMTEELFAVEDFE